MFRGVFDKLLSEDPRALSLNTDDVLGAPVEDVDAVTVAMPVPLINRNRFRRVEQVHVTPP